MSQNTCYGLIFNNNNSLNIKNQYIKNASISCI